jgi:hypothetical protein
MPVQLGGIPWRIGATAIRALWAGFGIVIRKMRHVRYVVLANTQMKTSRRALIVIQGASPNKVALSVKSANLEGILSNMVHLPVVNAQFVQKAGRLMN